jgi:hypothetical protein
VPTCIGLQLHRFSQMIAAVPTQLSCLYRVEKGLWFQIWLPCTIWHQDISETHKLYVKKTEKSFITHSLKFATSPYRWNVALNICKPSRIARHTVLPSAPELSLLWV